MAESRYPLPPRSHTPRVPIPDNLYRLNNDAFNVDPNVPYLEARGENTHEHQVSPTGRNFVGGFVGGVKRAFRGNRPNRSESSSPEEGPGIVIVTTNPERLAPSPSQLEHQMPHAQFHPTTTSTHVSQAPMHPQTPPPPQGPPSVASTSRKSDSTVDGHATAINHGPLIDPLPIGSPVSVEPQLASDYAKMPSPTPPPSTASLGSYISRVGRFFKDLNNLPWVASERVTIDYYPGYGQRAARRRSVARAHSPLPTPPQRPVVSWYDTRNQAKQGLVELFSPSSSSSTVMAEVQIEGAQPLPKGARVVYPMVYGPASTLPHNQYSNTAPAPAAAGGAYHATARTQSSSSSHEASYDRPVYPHGYVSYQQHGAAGTRFSGDAIHHLV